MMFNEFFNCFIKRRLTTERASTNNGKTNEALLFHLDFVNIYP